MVRSSLKGLYFTIAIFRHPHNFVFLPEKNISSAFPKIKRMNEVEGQGILG
jgi:hypothetical protein